MKAAVFLHLVLPGIGLVAGATLAAGGMTYFQKDPVAIAPAAPSEIPPPGRLTWRDLADADSARFAANLRAIGCPEDTILRIVTTDEDPSTPAEPVPAATPTQAVVPVAMPVPVAMAPAPPAVAPIAPIAPPPPAGPDVVIVAPQGHVPLPVAFQELPQDGQMTPEQRAKLTAIQDAFIAAIGGANQDPNSAEYLARWREAQRKSDVAFKTAFGQGEFIRRQMARLRAEQSARPGS
ncbi:MAG TPA: hypothetical protein VIM61_09555 [Chthoniobacterales bacterium]|jgi:hypothetical protein